MKQVTETVGTATQIVNFGQAIKALNDGKRVRRNDWGEESKFIFRQVPSQVPADVVSKMSSLPQSVKDYFKTTFENEQIDAIYYSNQIAHVGLSNMVTSWSPSTTDAMAEDWIVLD